MITIAVTLVKRIPFYDLEEMEIQLPSVPREGEQLVFITKQPKLSAISVIVTHVSYTIVDGEPASPPVAIRAEYQHGC